MGLDYWHIGNNNTNCFSQKEWRDFKYAEKIKALVTTPYRHKNFLRSQHIFLLKKLLIHAYKECSAYKEKFNQAGIVPESFKKFSDLRKFPILEKKDLISSDDLDFIAESYKLEKLFRTRTCGTTSGRRQYVYFNKEAILNDTLQGVQQLHLQADENKKFTSDDLTIHYYVNKWWSDSINNTWPSKFISSDVLPHKAANIIRDKKPSVLAGYPSDLRRLMKHIAPGSLNLKLIITNSEFSTRAERNLIAAHFNCQVLDEYSSEELTRIALELPDGRYYVCQDSVYLEVLDPITREPTPDGEWGEAVVTGLLNKAMPYIRYATGDWVKKSPNSRNRHCNWQCLEEIGGRIIDSLVSTDAKIIPQNTILNKLDTKSLEEFEEIADYRIYQQNLSNVTIAVRHSSKAPSSQTNQFVKYAKECITKEIGSSINFNVIKTRKTLFDIDHQITKLPKSKHYGQKRRRIRFLGDISKYMSKQNKTFTPNFQQTNLPLVQHLQT